MMAIFYMVYEIYGIFILYGTSFHM